MFLLRPSADSQTRFDVINFLTYTEIINLELLTITLPDVIRYEKGLHHFIQIGDTHTSSQSK